MCEEENEGCECEGNEPMAAPMPPFANAALQQQREQIEFQQFIENAYIGQFMNVMNVYSSVWNLPPEMPQPVKNALQKLALMTVSRINPQFAEILKTAGFGV